LPIEYVTRSGDTWDAIASRALGDELQMSAMIEANPDHRNTVEFSAGVVLAVPVLPADTSLPNGLPPWRRP